MLEVCLLGTGGMMPLPYRWLTSMMARFNGSSVLIDCGEGTQIALKEKGWSPKPIDVICFTHYHADHISGLPGMLLTMGNAERTQPLLLIGPKGLTRVVNALRVIAPELPFEIICQEITEAEQTFQVGGMYIDAFKVNHGVLCYGYNIRVPRIGRFQVEKAQALGIDRRYWNPLQKGQTVEVDGQVYTPDMVLGADRRGLKVTYCTDTRPTDSLLQAAQDADLFIGEGMYGEPDKQDKAKEHKHMSYQEAAGLARDAEVKELWLTHFSPAMPNPRDYLFVAKEIFPNTKVGKDRMIKEFKFDETE